MLPLVKLGSLAFRTLSKPIAARLKHNAGIHPKFRGFIIGIAQIDSGSVLVNMEVKAQYCAIYYGNSVTDTFHGTMFRQTIVSQQICRRLYGRATDIHIRPLNEEKAIQAAADLLGELFVFSVAGAAIIYEVQRSARSEARKEEVCKQEIEAIKKREEQLAIEVQLMKQRINEMELRYSKWTRPVFRSFGTAQAAAQPAVTQQPTAA